ncbi:hypothetical protein BX666DRAFT_1988992 [Dichotomocladium elegans]|nr:hypothetical protein BX666DRAFT_1988992 [Dichotomocladium elegans]
MSSPATSTTSVSSIRDVGDRILSEHRERLLEVVDIVHATTVHAFSFSKYIFLNELQTDQDFDIAIFLNSRFFLKYGSL